MFRAIAPGHAFEPPCVCTKCEIQFRTVEEQIQIPGRQVLTVYRFALTKEEASQTLATRMEHIKNDLQYLQNICATHGDLIMSHWKNKNRAKREEILLKADPNMYPTK